MLPNIPKESNSQRNHTTHQHRWLWFTNPLHQTFTRKKDKILAIIKNKLATNTITQRKSNHCILLRRQIKMHTTFTDLNGCSITFSSEDYEDEQLLRDIYLNVINKKPTELKELLTRLKENKQ